MNVFFEAILTYVGKRLTEPSTWRGIILFVAGSWGEQHPEITNDIINYTFIIVGLIGALMPDSVIKRENKENLKKTIEVGLDNIFSNPKEEQPQEDVECYEPVGFNDQSLPPSPLESSSTSQPRVSTSSPVRNNHPKSGTSSTTSNPGKGIHRVSARPTTSSEENFSSSFNDK